MHDESTHSDPISPRQAFQYSQDYVEIHEPSNGEGDFIYFRDPNVSGGLEYPAGKQVISPIRHPSQNPLIKATRLSPLCSQASAYMVVEGKWGMCEETFLGGRMPMHRLSEGEVEERFVSIPMSRKCCDHMDVVLAFRADLKPSKASGLV